MSVPSTRDRALRSGVHVMTAARASQELQRMGVLERRRGRGYVVCVGAQARARELIAWDLAVSCWPQVRAVFAALGAPEAVAAGDRAIAAIRG